MAASAPGHCTILALAAALAAALSDATLASTRAATALAAAALADALDHLLGDHLLQRVVSSKRRWLEPQLYFLKSAVVARGELTKPRACTKGECVS